MQTLVPSSPNAGNLNSPTSTAIPELFPFDSDLSSTQDWPGVANMLIQNDEMAHWSYATITQSQQLQSLQLGQSSTATQIPWNSQFTTFGENANAGNVAFEPSPGPGFGAYILGQDFLDARQRENVPQVASSPTGDDSEYEGWHNVKLSSYANSSIPSQGSPHSAGSSPFEVIDTPYQTPSPRPHHNDNDHQHFFTVYPGIKKQTQKMPRGRQRALTVKEKKEAREVREAKACWACHLSKIKV